MWVESTERKLEEGELAAKGGVRERDRKLSWGRFSGSIESLVM